MVGGKEDRWDLNNSNKKGLKGGKSQGSGREEGGTLGFELWGRGQGMGEGRGELRGGGGSFQGGGGGLVEKERKKSGI